MECGPLTMESVECGHHPSPHPAAVPLQVLNLVPTAATSLLRLLVSHMPHKLRDRDAQCLYLSAVFHVAEAPSGATIRWARWRAVGLDGERPCRTGLSRRPLLPGMTACCDSGWSASLRE